MLDVKWQKWNERKYLYNDFRGAKCENDLLDILEKEICQLQIVDEKTPILSNYSGVILTSGFFKKVKESFKDIGGKKISKSAVIGMVGLNKFIMDMYLLITRNKQTRTFIDERSALYWLFS